MSDTKEKTDNRTLMREAVHRWTTEAQDHPEGARHLEARAGWVERQIQTLFDTAERDEDPPEHLTGLRAWDLIAAAGELQIAAARLRKDQGKTA